MMPSGIPGSGSVAYRDRQAWLDLFQRYRWLGYDPRERLYAERADISAFKMLGRQKHDHPQ